MPAPDPATPTVAAPAPMNFAAVSMSRLTALVWKPRTANCCWEAKTPCGSRSEAHWKMDKNKVTKQYRVRAVLNNFLKHVKAHWWIYNQNVTKGLQVLPLNVLCFCYLRSENCRSELLHLSGIPNILSQSVAIILYLNSSKNSDGHKFCFCWQHKI